MQGIVVWIDRIYSAGSEVDTKLASPNNSEIAAAAISPRRRTALSLRLTTCTCSKCTALAAEDGIGTAMPAFLLACLADRWRRAPRVAPSPPRRQRLPPPPPPPLTTPTRPSREAGISRHDSTVSIPVRPGNSSSS
eukprot:5693143-Pleurochrysis_carterae.AAC.2